MAITLTIRDETATGEKKNEFKLDFLTEHITVRELIRSRVHQEVKDFNAGRAKRLFQRLVRPTDAEEELNGYRLKTPRMLDWNRQLERAMEAFEKNQVLILVDDKQVEGPDQEIEIRTDTRVTFLKLVPLVGG